MAEGCRVCILGDINVGKTSFCHRFVEDNFTGERNRTKVMAQREKTMKIGNRNVKFMIWDTAGDERFRSVISIYYRGANAVILIYDVTNRETLENVEYWLGEVKKNAGKECLVVIAGNKSDLQEDVSESEGQEFAKKHGARHFRTSAKTGQNVCEIFQHVGKNFKTLKFSEDNEDDRVKLENPEDQNKKDSGCGC